MKKIILTVLLLGFVSLNGYCQKVYKTAGGTIYLECTVANGMPAGSTTTTPKCVDGNASSSTYRNGLTTGANPYDSENDAVFEKLEIAPNDAYEYNKVTWLEAYNVCKNYTNGWRLPTERELILIYLFRVQIKEMSGYVVSSIYWSSREESATRAWIIDYSKNQFVVSSGAKTGKSAFVRCVREAL